MPNTIVDGTIRINSAFINWFIGIGINWLRSAFTEFLDKFRFRYTELFPGERALFIGPIRNS